MEYSKKPLNQVKRNPKRGFYDQKQIFDILDSHYIAYMSYFFESYPITIPMAYGRKGNEIYIHGSTKNRMMNAILENQKVSLTVSEFNALVLAKSVFHHSMNYRTAIVFGNASLLTSKKNKIEALEIITENILKGRWAEARFPNDKELKATSVIKIEIETASAKIRDGEPIDEKEDLDSGIWSGLLPIENKYGEAITDSQSKGLNLPKSVQNPYLRNE